MVTHSSILAWRIPWIEKPGRLQSMRSKRVGHDFTFTFNLDILFCEVSAQVFSFPISLCAVVYFFNITFFLSAMFHVLF